MVSPIFRVDVSEGSRDYQPTATEPGLPMLDRQNANYAILHRWLGDRIAEPQWENAELVAFYIRDEERGRLESPTVLPASKSELEGSLKEDLEAIQAGLKKAKPESSTEQSLLRVARERFNRTTRNLEDSDHDSFFFKYRYNKEPWRLVWCWGYQRADLEPAASLVCTNEECKQLYVRRPGNANCPACSASGTRTAKKASAGSRFLRAASLLLLLLLLAVGLLMFLNPPKLVIANAPENEVPPGSRIHFSAIYTKWYFFKEDVTERVRTQSHNKRVLEFEPAGAEARALSKGEALSTFRYMDHAVDVTVKVGDPKQPKSISIEPESPVKLAVGSSRQLKATAHYDDLDDVDLTELVEWQKPKEDDEIYLDDGMVEGVKPGKAQVTARYRASEDDPYVQQSAEIDIADVPFKSLALELSPDSVPVGAAARLDVFGIGDDDQRYPLTGSTRLRLDLLPPEGEPAGQPGRARFTGENRQYIRGEAVGPLTVRASVGETSQSLAFQVTPSDLKFAVSPTSLNLLVDSYYELDITAPSSDPLEIKSSNESFVRVVPGSRKIVGVAPGQATVTVKQGGNEQAVEVNVTAAAITALRFERPLIRLRVGLPEDFRVLAVRPDGTTFPVAPEQLEWVRQPLTEYIDIDRAELQMLGQQPTPQPLELVVQLRGKDQLKATAQIEVLGSVSVAATGSEWQVHPPLPFRGGYVGVPTGGYLRDSLVYDDRGRGLVIKDVVDNSPLADLGLLPGTVITRVGDRSLAGMSAGEIKEYFANNPIGEGTRIAYLDPNGRTVAASLGKIGRVVLDVAILSTKTSNVGPVKFDADVTVQLRKQGQYRIIDGEKQPLTDWAELPAGSQTTIAVRGIPRAVDQDEVPLFVERKTGDTVIRYPFNIELKNVDASRMP